MTATRLPLLLAVCLMQAVTEKALVPLLGFASGGMAGPAPRPSAGSKHRPAESTQNVHATSNGSAPGPKLVFFTTQSSRWKTSNP